MYSKLSVPVMLGFVYYIGEPNIAAGLLATALGLLGLQYYFRKITFKHLIAERLVFFLFLLGMLHGQLVDGLQAIVFSNLWLIDTILHQKRDNLLGGVPGTLEGIAYIVFFGYVLTQGNYLGHTILGSSGILLVDLLYQYYTL